MKALKIEIPKGYKIDEEKSTFENIVFKPITEKPTEYVDLGLPSGTLWAVDNEDGYYSYQDAINTFGKNNLPKLTDFAELYDYCEWKWNEEKKGMVVIGPNGNNIFFPASGFRSHRNGELGNVGFNGCYWSVTPNNSSAYGLSFYNDGGVVPAGINSLVYKFSIRKIKRK